MSNIIRGLRIIKGFRQEDVAKAIGITVRTYNSKEGNPDKFTIEEIKKIANFLGVKEEIFFKEEFTFKAN